MLSFLRATLETTQGSFPASPPAASQSYMSISSDNGFPGRQAPIFWGPIREATGGNRPLKQGSGQVACTGSFATPLYMSQAKLLLPWACTIGTTLPYDLTTLTWDYAQMMAPPANTLWYERQLGAKCNQFRMSANNEGAGLVVQTNYDYNFMQGNNTITSTDLPPPTFAQLPPDQPVVLPMLAGGLTLGTARTMFASFGVTMRHTITPMYDEFKYPNYLYWGGREVTATFRFRFVSATDRQSYLNNTPETCSLTITDGTTTIHMDLHTKGYITEVRDDTRLAQAGYQDITFTSMLDTSGAGASDFDLTITP